MCVRYAACIGVLLAFCFDTAGAANQCTMVRAPDIQVTMNGLTPLVSVKINGTAERLILDSGAAYSTLSLQAAGRLRLPQYRANFYMEGVTGGRTPVRVATAKAFTLAKVQLRFVDFTVVPGIFDGEAAGLLGQNVLRFADDEYDLADGVVRLFHPIHCGDRPLAYWAASQPVSVVDLRRASALHPHLVGPVLLDGKPFRALFDTGANHSIVSLHAARLVGVTPHTPGVTSARKVSGLGGVPVRVWSAPFDSIDIGGEKILHTRVLIGDFEDGSADMILGADFFLAHRVYVENSRNRLYFTYNGGPVFNLNTPPAGSPSPASPASSSASASAAAPANQPTDGEGFMRRGMAYAARHELAEALADLSRACQLSPHDPQVFYQRALLYRQTGQRALALKDLDRAVALDPRALGARAARAALQLPNRTAVDPDLDAIARLAPPEGDVRVAAAYDYGQVGEYAAAVHQYDVWIDSHKQDKDPWAVVARSTLATAFSDRCWAEAAADIDLGRAMSDCDKALRLMPNSADTLANRALAHLQRRKFDAAISDYDASLKLRPRQAEALYGRGIAEKRKGQEAAARADVAAAVAIKPGIARRFASFGLHP